MNTRIGDKAKKHVANRTKKGGGERVKKVIGIALVMLLVCAVMASADATNWRIQIKASDTAGTNYSTNNIGWWSGYTNGIDTPNEPATLPTPLNNKSLGYAPAVLPDGTLTLKDYRTPLAQGQPETLLTWNLVVFYGYTGTAPAINPVMVTFTQSTSSYTYDYSYGPLTISVRNTVEYGSAWHTFVYDAANPLTTLTVRFVEPSAYNYDIANPEIIITAGGVIPEPGSMLALGSGLVGLLGFAIRRRR